MYKFSLVQNLDSKDGAKGTTSLEHRNIHYTFCEHTKKTGTGNNFGFYYKLKVSVAEYLSKSKARHQTEAS